MSASSSYSARRGGSRAGGGSRQMQFPVRRWRHVAVVDAGCGCRPRRATTRLLSQLPSFLRPSPGKTQAAAAPVGRSSSRSSSGFFPSSASTASCASAATFTTTHSSYSAYDSSAHDYNYNLNKQQLEEPSSSRNSQQQQHVRKKNKKKTKRYEQLGAAATATAVEKESSDPRADFRESMLQMVVETGLCGWDDLRCMLRRLLALNAPRHHAAILAAFAEVCAQLTAPAPPPPQPAYQYHSYNDDYHYHY